MEYSATVIVVVGRMTLEEQRLISYISSEYKNKNIIIVHNYLEFRDI